MTKNAYSQFVEWIALADQLPTRDDRYLVYAPSADPDKPLIITAWYNPTNPTNPWSLLPEIWIDAITHWMEIPKPPPPG